LACLKHSGTVALSVIPSSPAGGRGIFNQAQG
jgi:hypothetical protein